MRHVGETTALALARGYGSWEAFHDACLMVAKGDEEAIADLLVPEFGQVETVRYWSSQGTPQQRAGEKLGMFNTFAIFARDYHPPGEAANPD